MAKDFGNTQELVAVEDIKDGTIILKGGSLRQVVMVSGINFALKSEEEQNVITQTYQNFLNSLDFQIQVIIHSRKVNIEKYLENFSRYENQDLIPLLKNQAAEYKEFIRGFVEKNAIMEKSFLIVVPFSSVKLPGKESVSGMIPFLGKKSKEKEEKNKEEAEANFRADLEQIGQRTNQILGGISSIGLDAAVLNTEQLIQLFYNFYNPETVEKEQIEIK